MNKSVLFTCGLRYKTIIDHSINLTSEQHFHSGCFEATQMHDKLMVIPAFIFLPRLCVLQPVNSCYANPSFTSPLYASVSGVPLSHRMKGNAACP